MAASVAGSDEVLVASVEVAKSPWSRFWGLMGRKHLESGHALLIDPCSSVHTMFMRFPIDVIYLDRERRVTKIVHGLRAYRASLGRGARSVLEMGAGEAARAGLQIGDVVSFTDVS